MGYRFADSSEWRGVLQTALPQVDLRYLQKMKRKQAALNASQIDLLMDAIFGAGPTPDPAACYDPHHIFLFYRKDLLVGAFEFCLGCRQYRAWPRRDLGVKEDYVKLAALCRQLGLGKKPSLRSQP